MRRSRREAGGSWNAGARGPRVRRALWIAASGAWFLAGCRSPEPLIARATSDLRSQWSALAAQVAAPEAAELRWPEACGRLWECNTTILQARDDLAAAEEGVRLTRREWLPRLNFRAGISKRVGEVAELSSGDFTVSQDILLNTDFLGLPRRLFEAALRQAHAETVLTNLMRTQIAELYRLFGRGLRLQQTEAELAAERRVAEAWEQAGSGTGQVGSAFGARVASVRAERRQLDQALLRALGASAIGKHWRICADEMPSLQYEHCPPRRANMGIALSRLEAIEALADERQITSLKRRYWPDIWLSATGPRTYRWSGDGFEMWDPSSARMAVDLFWQPDLRGELKAQLRQAGRSAARRSEDRTLRAVQLLAEAEELCALLAQVRDELAAVQRLFDAHCRVPPAATADGLKRYWDELCSLRTRVRALQNRLMDLNASVWVLDDHAWDKAGEQASPAGSAGGGV